MCNLETEGTKYGCGHYVITKKLNKIDCANRYCVWSNAHPQSCRTNCQCEQFLGPDASETVTAVTRDYCPSCHHYYVGAGRR